MHAEVCPVCKGQPPHQVESEYGPVTCHGCNGKGWVEVQDEPPPSDAIYVTNDPIIDEHCDNINKPIASGGL